jgi:hypothetical protein
MRCVLSILPLPAHAHTERKDCPLKQRKCLFHAGVICVPQQIDSSFDFRTHRLKHTTQTVRDRKNKSAGSMIVSRG